MNRKSLILFMTKNGSLSRWMSMGNLNREIDIYKKMFKKGFDVSVISFNKNDKKLSSLISPIKVYPLRLSPYDKDLFKEACEKYKDVLETADLYKTNQVKGADLAIKLGKKFKKPVIVRSGYLPSIHPKKGDEDTINDIEKRAFLNSNLFFVSSLRDKAYMKKKYKILEEKIKLLPNYVNTNIFKPKLFKKSYDIIYIGRGSDEKNLMLLLESILILKKKGIKTKSIFIGTCYQKEKLVEFSKKNNLNIKWKGSVSSEKLPYYLNKSKIFVLPSKHEGHPKALIEAMSCGLMCIGTNVEGIKEIISNKKNGILSASKPEKLSLLILKSLKNKEFREFCGKNAREMVINNFSLEKILEKEISFYNNLLLK